VRVTDSLVFQSAILQTGRAREAAEQAQQVASSGARLSHPADDPAGAGLLVAYRMNAERFTAIASATAAASDELTAMDGALGDVSTTLARAKELAVQFASAGHSSADANVAAQEVDGLVGEVRASLNARYGDRYLFGGSQDRSVPFDAGGAYHGDAAVRQVEIAPGVLQPVGLRADAFAKGAGGGVDLFQALGALRTALQQADPDAVRAAIDGLDAGAAQVSAARAQAGTYQHAVDAATSASRALSESATVGAGKVADADLIESALRLQASQTALEASLSAAAQSFRLSLVKYLG
jgi:flagellar hook-associated protein 3 FlgL